METGKKAPQIYCPIEKTAPKDSCSKNSAVTVLICRPYGCKDTTNRYQFFLCGIDFNR